MTALKRLKEMTPESGEAFFTALPDQLNVQEQDH